MRSVCSVNNRTAARANVILVTLQYVLWNLFLHVVFYREKQDQSVVVFVVFVVVVFVKFCITLLCINFSRDLTKSKWRDNQDVLLRARHVARASPPGSGVVERTSRTSRFFELHSIILANSQCNNWLICYLLYINTNLYWMHIIIFPLPVPICRHHIMGYLITWRACGFILSMLWRKNSASDGGAKGLRADITTGAKYCPCIDILILYYSYPIMVIRTLIICAICILLCNFKLH